jgi:SAM-dependent methyltransferase
MLTIDFSVDVGERQVMSSSGKGLVPFTAKGFNSAVNVAWITCERKRFPKNSIVEFSWRDEQFHPVRLRSDKEKPNALEIARDNFKHILEALTYDTVCGLNGDLMRKYHNRVKTLLYETAALSRVQLLGQKSEYTLLDLGSGEGGDIHKWAKIGFTRVVAVEPSDNNIESLRLRIEEALRSGEKEVSSYPEIEVLQAGAEDTDKIVSCAVKTLGENPKFDVISAMLSASFFFRDDSTFKSVVRTIKEHSKKGSLFLIFTINGQLIEEMMSPSMREGAILTSPLVLGDFRLDLPLDQWAEISGRQIGGDQGLKDYATGRSYNFTFKGTKTVHGAEEERDTAQIEYMVYIPMLTEALKPEFALKNHEIADKEPLLDGSYRIASSLYSYAIYQRMS